MTDSWTSGTFECETQRKDGKRVCAGPKGGKAWVLHTHIHTHTCIRTRTYSTRTLRYCDLALLWVVLHMKAFYASCCLRWAGCRSATEHRGSADGQFCVEQVRSYPSSAPWPWWNMSFFHFSLSFLSPSHTLSLSQHLCLSISVMLYLISFSSIIHMLIPRVKNWMSFIHVFRQHTHTHTKIIFFPFRDYVLVISLCFSRKCSDIRCTELDFNHNRNHISCCQAFSWLITASK